jgi:hypothetical protein
MHRLIHKRHFCIERLEVKKTNEHNQHRPSCSLEARVIHCPNSPPAATVHKFLFATTGFSTIPVGPQVQSSLTLSTARSSETASRLILRIYFGCGMREHPVAVGQNRVLSGYLEPQ